jgi:hypothetical protein
MSCSSHVDSWHVHSVDARRSGTSLSFAAFTLHHEY